MGRISIRKMRSLIFTFLASLLIILTFSALTSKGTYSQDTSFIDSLGNEKDLKETFDTGFLGDKLSENVEDPFNQDKKEGNVDEVNEAIENEDSYKDPSFIGSFDKESKENVDNEILEDNDEKDYVEDPVNGNDIGIDDDEIDDNENNEEKDINDINNDDGNDFDGNDYDGNDDNGNDDNGNDNDGNDDHNHGEDNFKDPSYVEPLEDERESKENNKSLDDNNEKEKEEEEEEEEKDYVEDPVNGNGIDVDDDTDDNDEDDNDHTNINNKVQNESNVYDVNDAVDKDDGNESNNVEDDEIYDTDKLGDNGEDVINVDNNFDHIEPDGLLGSKTHFKLYHLGSNYLDQDDPEGIKCPVPWQWVKNKEESDIIMLNPLDNLGDINRIEIYNYNKSTQKLLLMSMESTSNYNVMINKKQYFDYFIDYRLDSDVPIPYTYDFFDFTKPALPTKEKGKDGRGLAAVFISNCHASNKRLEFMEELMKYMKVDSYGICNNNKNVYEEDSDDSAWNTKMNTIRKYKFTLAFENSNDRDYVTEKFFQPLEAGSVPVFFGTSNIDDFAPPHSFINANDFNSAEELADYLNMLDQDDEEYETYLEWKKMGDLGDNLKRLIEIRKYNSICQLLQRIKGLWINPYLTKWDRHDVPKDERACGLC